LQALAALDAYVHYVDCGAPFYTAKGIDMALMPDALHPTHDGMELLAQVAALLLHDWSCVHDAGGLHG
jgi:hypothetical protein